ncbi:MAG: hypothetical protein IKL87_09005 [Oscillospiraceae bacterium]|nr:hypothetical protein [Oscillospiraceae bacterium]
MDYSDIIEHPHHVSTQRRRMTSRERASQFLAFRALEGFEDALAEAVRVRAATYEQNQNDYREEF